MRTPSSIATLLSERISATARSSATRSSGPGITSFDASINKQFGIGNDFVEFRVEVFNLPNLPIWGQPGSQLRQPTTGVINSTRIDSRQIQLGLKYVF